MEEGSEGSEGSEESEDSEVLDAADSGASASDSDPDSDSDSWDGSEESGWFADPDVEGQERYFDGSEWTPDTRPADVDEPGQHLPDHAGELQRALAAATDDIDNVEDRLGTLFDRAEQFGERQGRAARKAKAHAEEVDDEEEPEFVLLDDDDEDEDEDAGGGGGGGGGEAGRNVYAGDPGSIERGVALAGHDQDGDDPDDAFAELDEALASEEPEKVKKGFFRRRS